MTVELVFLGNKTSRITDAKYMNDLGLRSKLSKRFKVTTNSMHKYLIVPNVLNSEFSVIELSKAWILDITYIRVEEGFLYLLIVLDSCDRKIIGWSLSDGLSAGETSLAAWSMVLKIEVLKKFGILYWPQHSIRY
jgi:putative transposase